MPDILPVDVDVSDAWDAIELVHCRLSTGKVVIYDPDWQSKADGEAMELWMQSDAPVDVRQAR